MKERLIEIDGAKGEGGGQILRSVLTLSLVTGKPCRLKNIRAKRSRPGLQPQHLQAVRAATIVSNAQVTGDTLGSQRLLFIPDRVQPGQYCFDIGTAGATSLVLQAVYLPLVFTGIPSTITIIGGTHVPLSPCFHYLDWQWCRFLAAADVRLALNMERAGFYPRGGGIIHATVHPTSAIKPLRLRERGKLLRIQGLSAVANLNRQIAERQSAKALQRLAEYRSQCHIAIAHFPALGKGTLLVLLAQFEHTQACFFALGAPGKPAERVADEAAGALLQFLAANGAVEPFLADQLLLPLSFAREESILTISRVTRHLLSNAEIIRNFLPVTLDIKDLGKTGSVRIRP